MKFAVKNRRTNIVTTHWILLSDETFFLVNANSNAVFQIYRLSGFKQNRINMNKSPVPTSNTLISYMQRNLTNYKFMQFASDLKRYM